MGGLLRDICDTEMAADSLLVLDFPGPEGSFFTLVPLLPRICFPVQVNRLPRETLLCATLYALPIPPPGASSEANKQKRVPEALGWVTTPLFNFRQYVAPGEQLLALEENKGGCYAG